MQKHLLAGIIFSALVFNYGSINPSKAETTESKSLLQRIIDKFGLNKQSVETEINSYRTERQETRWKQVEERLTQAVQSGKLTEAQKSQLLAKVKEWQESKDNWQDLSREEKTAKVKAHREQMEKWAEDNNIDLHEIMGYGFFREGNGMRNKGYGFGRKL